MTSIDRDRSHALPDLVPRHLPEVVSLRRIAGPSLVLVAVSLGSTELVLWPYITSRAGTGLLWIAVVAFGMQFVVNMEIERYTLATGETAVVGFTRLWGPWAWVFAAGAIVPWAWPAWATGAATMAGLVFGWEGQAVAVVSILGLVSIGVALSLSPVVYRSVERFQTVIVAVVAAFLVVASALATDGATWSAIVGEVGLKAHPDLTAALLLGVLALSGAGGTLNLALANWMRDKGMGMAALRAPLASPLTGSPAGSPPSGHVASGEGADLGRWKAWWWRANLEHLLLFVGVGLSVTVGFSVLATSTVFGQEVGRGFDFIRVEGVALGESVGPWLRTGFWLVGGLLLFATNLGIVDHMGRIVADILARQGGPWTESRLYLAVVWGEVALGSLILMAGVSEPVTLMVVAGALNGVVMLVYTVLLVQLNRTLLPAPLRVGGVRLAGMAVAIAVYAYLTVFLVWTDVVPVLGGGGS